ncbi:ABC transporter permease subunit [Nonomuraea sp. NN258]|uniref:ABC transporter permease n=1 Tax=Nonomuraea antri TaxID=2730852 RepID=UPI001567E34F|nr:ABC transporter permease [Nonomuraea antri]NRQ31784.1 ABC transporter permease subunit [Nonomuraea antri]
MKAALRGEWRKLRTLRSTSACLAALALLSVGFAALFSGGASEIHRERPADFDPTALSLQGGMMFGQLVVGLLGVLSITSEYATGTIHASLTAVPGRGRLFAAKAVVVGLVAAVAGLTAALGSFLVGQAALAANGVPHAGLGDPEVARAVLGGGLYLALIGPLGLALGFLTRSTAAGVTLLTSMTVLVLAVLQLLPPQVAGLWPTVAGTQVVATLPHSSPWPGFLLYAAFVAALTGAALVTFRRKDA